MLTGLISDSIIQITSRLMRMLLTLKDDNTQEKMAMEVELENLPERKILENKKVLTEKQLDKYRIKIENDINAKITDLNKEMHLINDQKWVNVEKEIEESISKIPSIDKAKEALKSNLYGKMLLDHSHNVSNETINFISDKLNTIYNEQLVDINGNLPTINFNSGGKIDITIPNADQINDEVNINQDQLNDLERQKANKERELSSKGESESNKIQKEVEAIEKNINEIENQASKDRRKLGSRPEKEYLYQDYYYATRTREVDDSHWYNPFSWGDTRIESYEEKVYYWVTDDSEGEKWDEKIRKIDDKYRGVINNKETELEAKRKLLNNALLADKMKERLRSDIGDIEEKIKEEKVRQEEERAKGIETILNNVKSELNKSVYTSIFQLKKDMGSNIDENLTEQKKIMINDLKMYYENETKKQLSKIDGWIKDLENKGKNKETKERTVLLESDLNNIEEIEKQINKIA